MYSNFSLKRADELLYTELGTLIVWAFTPKNHKRQLHNLPIFVFINIPVTDRNYPKL